MKIKAFFKNTIFQKIVVVIVILCMFTLFGYRIYDVTGTYREKYAWESSIDAYMKDHDFSGVILLAKGENIIFIKPYGMAAEGKEFTVNTVMPIFSITKQFTAYGIMLLEQEGKLSRSDKLSKYFDHCKYGDYVTIDDLLTMTSGIPEYVGNPDIFPNAEDVSSYTSEVNRDELLNGILSLDLYKKGEYDYSNSNYYLLGVIIENVSGMQYEEFIKEKVTGPAGMRHVSFDPHEAESMGYVVSQDGKGHFEEEYDKSITFSAGSICTTASNLYRWQKYLYSDKSPVKIKELFTEDKGYNFGLAKLGTTFSHSGGGLYHRLWMAYDSADDTQIIIMGNSKMFDEQEMGEGLDWALQEY